MRLAAVPVTHSHLAAPGAKLDSHAGFKAGSRRLDIRADTTVASGMALRSGLRTGPACAPPGHPAAHAALRLPTDHQREASWSVADPPDSAALSAFSCREAGRILARWNPR